MIRESESGDFGHDEAREGVADGEVIRVEGEIESKLLQGSSSDDGEDAGNDGVTGREQVVEFGESKGFNRGRWVPVALLWERGVSRRVSWRRKKAGKRTQGAGLSRKGRRSSVLKDKDISNMTVSVEPKHATSNEAPGGLPMSQVADVHLKFLRRDGVEGLVDRKGTSFSAERQPRMTRWSG